MTETGSVSSKLSQISSSLGIQQSEPDALDELSEYCPKLSFQQRVSGFCICFSVGYLITFGSFSLFIELVEGNPIPFAMTYTLGNIMSLLSSTFLCGPKSQFKSMFHKKRRVTTIVYLSTLFFSLIFCFIPMQHDFRLVILVVLVMVQFFSLMWYCLTFIPFARDAVKRCFKDTIGLEWFFELF